jgi:hypothetical protein
MDEIRLVARPRGGPVPSTPETRQKPPQALI